MRPVVVGLGEPLAGDDGVGPAVVQRLRSLGIDARVAPEASLVTSLLLDGHGVVVVDAALGAPLGHVRELLPRDLLPGGPPISSHGLALPRAIELARALGGDRALRALHIVVVGARAEDGPGATMSPEVAAALDGAASLCLELVGRARAT